MRQTMNACSPCQSRIGLVIIGRWSGLPQLFASRMVCACCVPRDLSGLFTDGQETNPKSVGTLKEVLYLM